MERIVGDKVICYNSKPLLGNDVAPPIKEGESYRIVEIYKCTCGQEHYNIGLISNYNFITCYKCREFLPKGSTGGTHWCHPSRFIDKA